MRPLLLSALVFSAQVAAQSCFFPNGKPAGSDTACNPNAIVSACCFDNQACLSNGLCVSDPHDAEKARLHRGTCTDAGWKSGNCPRECLNIDNNGVPVYSCNSTTTDSYCCFDGCKCNNPNFETFEFAQSPADVYTVTIIGESFTQTHLSTSTTPPPSTSSTTTTSSASTSTVAGSSQFSQQFSSAASNPTATSSATASSAAPPPSSESNKPNTTALGVGLGIGIPAAALLGTAIFFLCRRRQRTNAYPAAIELGGDGYAQSSTTKYAHIAEAEVRGIAEVEVGTPRSELDASGREYRSELPGHAMPGFSPRKA